MVKCFSLLVRTERMQLIFNVAVDPLTAVRNTIPLNFLVKKERFPDY